MNRIRKAELEKARHNQQRAYTRKRQEREAGPFCSQEQVENRVDVNGDCWERTAKKKTDEFISMPPSAIAYKSESTEGGGSEQG